MSTQVLFETPEQYLYKVMKSYTLTAVDSVTLFIIYCKKYQCRKESEVHSGRVKEALILFQLRKHKTWVHAKVTDVVFRRQIIHYPPSLISCVII